ncbi:acyl-CoA carboxylase subunit epsilon [Verrucosispora sioxanthis]|uniref:acyl-CoA carboxylase subunit epsilon n=1 Tax=Verrucosispora sioxanthis TaxID=2499994 RepID=UPI001C111C11|nr:acyl-CoA carboxylase subunit epsilon [Verrucosispora sioxanthis]
MSVEEPLFRVVRGVPTAEELAALVGVIAVRSRPTARSWARSGRPTGAGLTPGAGNWRTAGLPR